MRNNPFRITIDAEDKRIGMTPRELEKHLAGCPDDAEIRVVPSIGGRIRQLIFLRRPSVEG